MSLHVGNTVQKTGKNYNKLTNKYHINITHKHTRFTPYVCTTHRVKYKLHNTIRQIQDTPYQGVTQKKSNLLKQKTSTQKMRRLSCHKVC